MFLKSLEINGFKSFAQKTILEFPSGITAIVGPNGSGKSNVIDAIRWLLGEREAKNLRGAKTEDLIFNGTPKRPRAGMAQASLYFDNASGLFPVDYKEVVITRRISRDGTAEYLLNKSEIKLKELVEFLNRARLGTKGLIIVNQGQSDIFVKAAPDARRIMIEEILGLREYQTKKAEAERKLKSTYENLEKVRAMAHEVAPRLRMLKKQTEKWAKRLTLEKDLLILESAYFSYKFREIKSLEEISVPKEKMIISEAEKKKKEIAIFEENLKKLENSFKEPEEFHHLKKEKQRLLDDRYEIQRELGKLEAKIEIFEAQNKEKKSFRNEDLVDLVEKTKRTLAGVSKSDFETMKKAVLRLISEIDVFLGEKSEDVSDENSGMAAELKKSQSALLKKIETTADAIKDIEAKEAEITAGLEGFNDRFRKAIAVLEEKRKELRGLEEQKNRLDFETEKIRMKTEELKNLLFQAGRKKEDFDVQNFNPADDLNIPEIERKMFRLRAELSSIGDVDNALIKEAEEVENHYVFLTSQSADLEKAADDLKALTRELSEKITSEFTGSLRLINEEFNKFFRLMFKGGSAKLKTELKKSKIPEGESGETKNSDEDGEKDTAGIEIEISLPQKRLASLEMLSGGEKSLVSVAALFALISVSPPPFLVLDEIDAALDENNSRRLADLIKESSRHSQFVIVTHNRSIMEVADVLYGVTIGEDGASKLLSLKLE